MNDINFNKKDIIFSLDIGTRSVIGTVGVVKDKKFHVLCESYIEHKQRAMIDGQISDITLVADAAEYVKKDIENKMNIKLTDVAIAAAGRFLKTSMVKAQVKIEEDTEINSDIIRSLEFTAVKKAEDKVKKSLKSKLYCVGYSVKNYYLNGYVISNLLSHKGQTIAAEVIATFLSRNVVESLYAVTSKIGLNVISLTLEPIAAIEAAIPQKLRLLNLALVDIGAGTSDIAISSKETISAYGMVPLAGDEVTEVIAQNLLVDFNMAEKIKRELSEKEKIKFTDVLGIESEITSKQLDKIICLTVDKIAQKIGKELIALNGGKSPNAVFLVGGGAHTQGLIESLAKILKLPNQRIAVKGREAVLECVCPDNSLGSTGVTVLGIALVALKKMGNDFIDVVLNGNVVSLFNSHSHNVMDVMMQAGINAKLLVAKNGKNVRFKLNGSPRIAFGMLSENTKITVNNIEASIDTAVGEGDNIQIDYAKNGRDAEPKILDYVHNFKSIGFYIDDNIFNTEPLCYINDKKVNANSIIHDGDEVRIVEISSINDIKNNYPNEKGFIFIMDDSQLKEDYIIHEGDRIYRRDIIFKDIVSEISNDKKNDLNNNSENTNTVHITVNDKMIELTGKQKYVFVDVFDFIDFNLSKQKGNLNLILNDKKAGYYDELFEKDIIKIFWEE